jgi:hypothetical protein
MRQATTILVLLACLCPVAGAQTAAPPAASPYPSNWVGVGAGFTSGATPPINGWASYAIKISDKGPIYSFSSYDIVSGKTKPFSIQTSVRTGFATVLRQWGPVYVLGFADAGMATAATVKTTAGTAVAATTVTGAFSGAGAVIWQIGKTHWTLEGCVRYLATPINGNSRVLEFGSGRTF